MSALPELLARRGLVVLDGGLASELERAGHDLAHPLWSARLLARDPEAIVAVHRAYLAAGADVVTSAAYQASPPGFEADCASPERARALYRSALALARRARDEHGDPARRVAASIGPYGAYLADGSEYRGRYAASTAELQDFHAARVELLVEDAAAGRGPDVVAVETFPSLSEAALVAELLAEAELDAWVSFSCRDGRTCEGQALAACARELGALPNVVALGVNCTAPREVPALLAELRGATELPLVCYPNSGERWDARAKRWHGARAFDDEDAPRAWLAAGARLLGGCCRTTPADVARLARLRDEGAAGG